jgi:Ig domain of plant-specific actin-binding protein
MRKIRTIRRPVAAAAVLVAVAAMAAFVVPQGEALSQVAPANTVEPAISGSAVTGQTLTASNGTWTGSPTSFVHQWLRCDTAGANCAPIGGATQSSYTVGSSDVGRQLRVRVTGTNADGNTARRAAVAGVRGRVVGRSADHVLVPVVAL